MSFTCNICGQLTPDENGAADEMPDSCDDCWVRWHWLWEMPAAVPRGGWGFWI